MTDNSTKSAADTKNKTIDNNLDKRKLELIQLETRYKASYRLIKETETESIIRLAIKPSDPDFPYEIESLKLQLNVPNDYPSVPCTLMVLNTDIPKGFAFNIERGYRERVTTSTAHQTLVRQMNWLDRNMETLLQQAPATTVRFVSHKVEDTVPERQFLDQTTQPIDLFTSTRKPVDIVIPSKKTHQDSASRIEHTLVSRLEPVLSSEPEQSSSGQSKTINENQTDPSKDEKKKMQHRYPKAKVDEAKVRRKQEFRQIQTRFCDQFKTLKSSGKETIASIILTLNDPDFTHEQLIGGKELYLKYHIPNLYPLEPATIEIENKKLDKTRASWITLGFNEYVSSGHLSLFENLNWLNRHFERLISRVPTEKTEEQIETERLAKLQETKPPRETQKLSVMAAEFTPKKKRLFEDLPKKNKVIIVNDPGLIVEPEVEIEVAPQEETPEEVIEGSSSREQTVVGLTQETIRKGTEIRLVEPVLENIALFRCSSLHLIVKCARCKDTVEVENVKPELKEDSKSTERWMACPTCTSILGIKFIGEYMHANASSMGLVQLAGCSPFDILPSTFMGTCGSCMEDMNSPIKLTFHDPARQLHCFACHAKMTCGLGGYSFVKIGSEGGERLIASEEQVMKLKKKKKSKEDPLTIGEPLPEQGTCSHYRKSKRWFRFSCCHKLYPCDICHDSHEDHISELAKRQVCGLCSREQSIQAGKPCLCGHEFEKAPQKGAFWEGGKGVRNKVTMSRKDPHKHKGLGKTTSKKNERVGVAGKERQNQQKDQNP